MLFFLLLAVSCFARESTDIDGFWKTVNEEGVTQCVVAVYSYDGMHYGRIIGSYDENGKFSDTIWAPKKRAPGMEGDPYYSGLDLIWFLVDSGAKCKGKIVDPEHGKIYNAELWVGENGNLVVRGKLLFFGRSQEWLPAGKSDFPKGFVMPKTKDFVPVIHAVK
ncbi:MAG: DUF2147 domain-containing protein [Verrucomicrobiota bacterium]|nr:DUF2147 domain-containing protein [Verrucomicrobiota bacterium]